MLFKNILVPWDGSKFSNHAFKIALDIAKKYNSKINVISCLSHADTGAGYIDVSFNKEIFDNAKKGVLNAANSLRTVAQNEGVPINIDVLFTEAIVKQIVTYAQSNKIDMIVMGSHGRTGWKKLLLGSVASGVSQQVHCPVLIVK